MALLAIFAIPLLGAAAPAALPSFPCAGALSSAEAAICGDPELAAWDRAVAKLYRVQRKAGDIKPSDQRQWLSRRNECGSNRTCLAEVYLNWPGFAMDANGFGTLYRRSGTQKRDPASLEIMPITDGWIYFSVTALHIQVAPGGVNDGKAWGLVQMQNGVGTFDETPGQDFACRFQLRQRGIGWSIEDFGRATSCGGLNVTLNGLYTRVSGKRR